MFPAFARVLSGVAMGPELLVQFLFETAGRAGLVLWIALIAFGIERLSRRYPISPERQLRGLGFAILAVPIAIATGWLMSGPVGLAGQVPLIHLRAIPWLGGHPVLLAATTLLLSIAVTDFFYYWAHRAQHAVPVLWRFHALHHSIRDLSALNNYSHWSEEAVQLLFKVIPSSLLIATDLGALAPAAMMLVTLHQAYIHSASDIHFGRWAWLINDNRRHRIHHSLEARHFDKNFGIDLGLWDHLFGTAHVPAADEWPETGLLERPDPATVGEFLAWPRSKARLVDRAVAEPGDLAEGPEASRGTSASP